MTDSTIVPAGRWLHVRRWIYLQLEPRAWPASGLSPVNKLVAVLIVASAALAIIETEVSFVLAHLSLFLLLEAGFASLFLMEYLARLWASVEDPRYGPGMAGRLRFMASPAAIFDLMAALPVLLALGGSELLLLRILRLVRVVRLARLGRLSKAMINIGDAIRSRAPELAVSLSVAVLLLVISSAVLYLVEGAVQPEAFGSIPRAMWWSVATLTTVGYGDVYPVTGLGRLFAAITAIVGIGLVAMPTGILAAAFSEAVQGKQTKSGSR